MCRLFAHQPQDNYDHQTRSLRIGGHATSIRLENTFWAALESLAQHENMSLAKFVTKLYDEVLDHHGEVRNFASLLRCCCLMHASRQSAQGAERASTAFPRGFLAAAE